MGSEGLWRCSLPKECLASDTNASPNLPNPYLPTYALPIILSLPKLQISISVIIFFFTINKINIKDPSRGDKPEARAEGLPRVLGLALLVAPPCSISRRQPNTESRTLDDNCDRLCRSCYLVTSKEVRPIERCYRMLPRG